MGIRTWLRRDTTADPEQSFEPLVVPAEADPGAIGAGNIWLRDYDDTAVTGNHLYQTLIRNPANDGWLRPQLLEIQAGVLRSRVTLDDGASGGDIEVRDASGTTLLLIAWDDLGEVDILNNAADSSWVNKLQMQAGFMLLERVDSGVGGSVSLDATGVLLSGSGGGHVNMPFLPTADPVVAGALWSDAGTVKVSAG